MTSKHPTPEDRLQTLLAAYTAPAEDNGFSDTLMATLRAQDSDPAVDLTRLAGKPAPIWRGWVIAMIIGLLCGLIWARLGVNLPDLSTDPSILGSLLTEWTAYGLAALGLAVCMLLIETEAF